MAVVFGAESHTGTTGQKDLDGSLSVFAAGQIQWVV
jgi:hypothetical protein